MGESRGINATDLHHRPGSGAKVLLERIYDFAEVGYVVACLYRASYSHLAYRLPLLCPFRSPHRIRSTTLGIAFPENPSSSSFLNARRQGIPSPRVRDRRVHFHRLTLFVNWQCLTQDTICSCSRLRQYRQHRQRRELDVSTTHI